MRSLRACPVEGYILQGVPVRMVFPQPFWTACPSTQAVSPQGFFSSCLIGISHLAACVCSVLSFRWEECILFISTVAFRQWSAAIKSLLPPEQTQPCQPPVLHPLLSPRNAWGQVLPDLSPHAGGPRLVTAGQTRPVVTVLPLGSALLVSSQSVSDLPYEDCVYLQVGVKCV